MSRLFSKSVGIICLNTTNRPASLVTSKSLATNVYTTNRRDAQVRPLTGIGTKDINRLITENSMISVEATGQKTLLISQTVESNDKDGKNYINSDSVKKENNASLEHLNYVADKMIFHLPRFFVTTHPFELYTEDIVFIDNVRSVRTQGLAQYKTRVALLKLYYHMRYSGSRVEVLNLVKDPEESCIKIRWRIITRPGLMQLITFKKSFTDQLWTDGISSMFVNKDGKIYCHVCDNIDVEKDDTKIKKTVKNPLIDRGLNV